MEDGVFFRYTLQKCPPLLTQRLTVRRQAACNTYISELRLYCRTADREIGKKLLWPWKRKRNNSAVLHGTAQRELELELEVLCNED